MTYKLTNTDTIIRVADNAFIPADTDNTDYAAYLTWLGQGNTPLPADPEPAPDIDALRKAAYTTEADPLYFKAMRQEIDIQEWHDKIEEIRLRYPKETE